MAKPTTRTDNPIERLLEERSQYVTWLARLDTTSDAVPAVPEGVRSRIRSDYQARLNTVVDELRSHTASIQEQLEEYRARRGELTHRENQAKEAMAEAEVRHAVGEYDEGKWQTIRADTARILVSVREELGRTTAEIDRLSEVLSLISAPVRPVPEPAPVVEPPAPAPAAVEAPPPQRPVPASPPPPAAPVPPLALDQEPVAPAAAAEISKPAANARPAASAKPAPVKPKEEGPGRTLWFPSGKPTEGTEGKLDELAFLKSVTGKEGAPPPKRASGGFSKPADPPAAAAPPAPAPTAPLLTPEPFASKTQMAVPDPAKERSQGSAPKTLKCGECGTMNRPTEWYCERCGAELAAL